MGGRKGSKTADKAVATSSTHRTGSHDFPGTTRKRKATHDPDQSYSETSTSPQSLEESKPEVQQDSEHDYSGPYPQLLRPTAQECQAARDGLVALHGNPKRAALGEEKFELAKQQAGTAPQASKRESWQRSVLDSLVCTILSQNTTDINSARAFAKLKQKFPEWELVRTANNGDIEESIKSGGLAAIKAERIKVILNTVKAERGECSLEHLRQSTDEEIKTELERFKGVGKKTVACVLMFCLDRHEFPVDTHVWRITKAMGWVPAKATRDEAYAHLNARIPDPLKYDLHVLLVNHGKRCPRCAKNGKPRKASDGDCPLFGGKSVTEVLQEDAENANGLQVKQEAENEEGLSVKPEEAEDGWDPAECQCTAKHEPDADHYPAIKHEADSEECEIEIVKPEPGLESGYSQLQQGDGNDAIASGLCGKRFTRSNRHRAITTSDV